MDNRILVVDDDSGILDAITLALEVEGYTVQAISRGEETFKQIETFKPKLILLDMYLSGTDGTVICQKLKKNAQTRNINVIMMSAHPTAEQYVRKVNADGFIPKPFDIYKLISLVEKKISTTN